MNTLSYFLFFCCFEAVQSTCASTENLKPDFIQCTFLNVALQENGGTSSAIVDEKDHPCPRLNDGKIKDNVGDNDKNSNAVVKIVFARPYLVDTVRITESDDGAQAEWIRVSFSDGSNENINLLAGSTDPEEVSFVPRVTSWMKFTVQNQYSEGLVRFTEIEVYNGVCIDENVCDSVEFSDTNKQSQRFVPGEVFSFLKEGKEKIEFRLSDSSNKLVYVVHVDDQIKLNKGGKTQVGPTSVPGADLEAHWIPFWVDIRKLGRVVIGTGATVLINYTETAEIKPLPITFFATPVLGRKVIFCGKKDRCHDDSSYFWPLDKLSNNRAYETRSRAYFKASGSVTMNLAGPALSLGNRSTVLLSDGSVDLSSPTSCLYEEVFCPEGLSFALWLKVESLSSTASYFLTGGKGNQGFSIYAPMEADRVNANNTLEVEFQNSAVQWRVSLPFSLQTWHSLACSWKATDGPTCLLDLSTVLKGKQRLPSSLFGPLTLGKSAFIPNSFGHSSVSSVAVWERKLTISEFQSLYNCMEIMPRPKTSTELGIGSFLLPDSSFTASSYTEDGLPHYVRMSLGGWISGVSDANQYLQIDFIVTMEVNTVHLQGNADLDAYVKKFMLAESKDGVAWTTVKTSLGTDKILAGNKDSSSVKKIGIGKYVVTRWLRFLPTLFHNKIALKLELIVKKDYANHLGCLPSSAVVTSRYPIESGSDPFSCIVGCGRTALPYALLADDGNCFCADKLQSTDYVYGTICAVRCRNKKTLKCGGNLHFAVYEVTEFANDTFKLSAPTWIKENTAAAFSFTSVAGTTFEVYRKRSALSTSSSKVELTFQELGIEVVAVEAQTSGVFKSKFHARHSILVVTVAKGLSLECPAVIVANRPYECKLSGFTGPIDEFSYSMNSSVLETSMLPMGFLGTVGGILHKIPNKQQTQSGLYFISSFGELGVVSSIEVNVDKIGKISVVILRPVCGIGVYREYCDVNKNCTYAHPKCDLTGYSCEDKMLHLPSGRCFEKDKYECQGTAKTSKFIPQRYHKYEVIFKKQVEFSKVGQHQVLGEGETVDVREKDVVGVYYPSAQAANLTVESFTAYEGFLQVEPTSLVKGAYFTASAEHGIKFVHMRHSLKAQYYVPQTRIFPISLGPGVHHAAISLENAINKFAILKEIVSARPIVNVVWNLDPIVATNDVYTITASAKVGTNITYSVHYDDGSTDSFLQTNISQPVIFTHPYTSPGYKFIKLRAYNHLSDEIDQFQLLVQDYIKDVNLTSPVKPARFTHITAIDWYIDSGSRVTIEIDLGDGTKFFKESLDINGILKRPIRHVYANPIEYWVNITAYNLVNRIELYFMIIVEIPIVDLTSRVIHANRDIEVNETVEIKLTQLNGTNVIHFIDFQDKSNLLTRETSIMKNYSYWAVFPVNITAWNNVSSVTWTQPIKVHKPIIDLTGFKIATSPTNHTDPVKFDFDMTTGSDFNCTWDFDDGAFGHSSYWITDEQVYKWPITHQKIYHMFPGIGVYHVRINCTNRLYATRASTISIVQVPVIGFELDQPDPQPNDEDLVVKFRAATGTNISYTVTFYHIWEKREIPITDVTISPDTLEGTAVIDKKHFTDRVGFYDVKVTAINLVTPLQTRVRTVTIDRPIRDVDIIIHAEYVETNRTVNYTIFADASNVSITWDFNDPYAGPLSVRKEWFQGVFSKDGWTVWHKFDHSGFYEIDLTLTNSLGTVTTKKQVKGEFGVYLVGVTDSPRPLPPGRMNFTFFPKPERYYWHPTDAHMEMTFGDGQNYSGPYNSTVIHFYESWGLFQVNVTIMNKISWGFFSFEVEIQRIIQGLVLTPFHSGGDAGYFGPARGPNLDRLPLEYDVIWNVTTSDGTNITYTFKYGDGDEEVTQNATVFHKYRTVDYFTATVFAQNAVSEGSTTFKIRIQQIVIGVDIDSNCPRKIGHPTTFRVTIEQVGTESCYLIRFGNNSHNYLYKDGSNTVCEQSFLDQVSDGHTYVFEGNSFVVNYTYAFIDVYWPRLIGSNLVSKIWKFHKAVVVWDHCDYPKVDIFNIGKNVTSATPVLRSQVFMVDTQNIVICKASVTTSFLWEVYEVNPVEGGNDTLYILPSNVAVNNPRFRIDTRLLPYGLYRMKFTITMLRIDGVLGSDNGFIQIIESPLIATVSGGSGISKGYTQNVTLDASRSQDPDVGPGFYQNITMAWECLVEGVSKAALTAQRISDAELKSGCSASNFSVLMNGSAADLVYLNTNFTVLPNVNYALRLTVVKNHRRMRKYFNIHSLEKDSLHIFVKCLQNCKKKRIAAVKLAYSGGIRGMDDPEILKRVTYKWELYAAPEPGKQFHRIGNDKWKEVKKFEEDFVLTATTTDTVVIGEKVLQHTSRYRLRLYVELDEQTGFAEEELFMNQPPRGGECSIDPKEGYALDTEFRVACSGWGDADLPLSYKFAYKTSDEDFEQLIYFGSKSATPPVKLPLGKANLNYSVQVIVDTADSLLAPYVTMLNVTVTAKPITSLVEFERHMIHMISQDGPLGNMMASGDAHSATQLVGALSSLLDNLASANRTSENQRKIDELRGTDTEQMKPEEIEELQRRIATLEEAERIQIQNETAIRVKMRKMMEETVSSIPIDSVEAIREKATASASLSNTPNEVTAEMQDSAMNAANQMIAFLGNSTQSEEPPNPQDTYNAAGGLINTLGNSMEASIETGKSYNTSDDGGDNTTKTESASRGLVTKAMENVENLASAVLTQKFAGEPPTEVKTERLSMAVQRADPSGSGNIGATTGGGDFMMPNVGALFGIDGNDTKKIPPVDTKAVANAKNPFDWDSSSSKVKSKVMTMELKNASGHPIKVSNLSKPIDMWVPRGMSVNFSLYAVNHGRFLYRAFPVVENDTSIQVEILAEDNNTELIAYLRFGKFPTEEMYDFKYVLPRRVFPVEHSGNGTANKTKTGRQINPYILFRSNEDLNRTAAGKYYIGIKYNGTFEPMYEAVMSGGKLTYKDYVPPIANFTMRTFTSSCLYWSIENDTWKSDGCVVGPKTAMEGTQCLCTHLTSFGGDMVVAPNTIDWSAISLDNLFSNPVVFAVVMSFIFLYFILLIPARRQDKKDLEKLGVVPLPDNDPRDQYGYEITVYTGFSAEAGTTADIFFILEGTRDETPVRVLKDPNKNKMSVGSINYFLLTVPSSLGKLRSIRIWHDNGGSSPSWYLLRLMVHDIQKDTKTWFLCDRWLAVEEDDGQIDRLLRPAGAEDLTKFNLLFQNEARKNLSDGHIWFSVVKRPARSNFTRVQRLSCCLCILLTTMLANAMFYQNDPSSSGDGVLKVGPMSFSVQQLSIAITSSLVVLPVNLFVVWIFRNARPKKTAREKQKEEEAKYEARKKKKDKESNSKKEKKEKDGKKKSSLPHYMVYVAYFAIFIACLVSATFTVFYGLTFGKAKSEAWISAMMISFWQDVLISQPLKVFAAATLFALLTKDPKKATGEDEEDTLPSPELQDDEEYTERNMEGRGLVSMARIDPKPPDPQKLQESRELRLKQKKMKYILYDIIWYFIFVTVLLSVAHGNKDELAYDTTSTMSSMFEGSSYTNWIDFGEITDPKLFWYWSRYTLLPTLIPNQWYGPNQILENVVWVKSDPLISRSRGARSRLNLNKNKIRKIQGRPGEFPDMNIVLNNTWKYPENFVADRATDYTVGVARLRQLRVKPNQCSIHPAFQHMFQECNSFYSWEKEDEGEYVEGWVKNSGAKIKKNDTATEKQKNAWQYNTAWELKGTPYWAAFSTYWGGGFVADLGHNETMAMNMTAYLQGNNWLDRYTRAIFLEFTIYNPNVNMFCLVTLVSEIIPTGAYYQFNQIYPVRLYRYYGPNLLAIMVLEITLMTFLLYFAYREFKKWRREGRLYWKNFWTYMELLVLSSCFSTIGLYFARMVATSYSIGLMRDDPESFVSFHYAAALDQWSTFTLGMAVFFSFLKTLSLLRFNRRMSFMSKTLKMCYKPLASFFLVYLVVFLAYASFGFIVFGKIATDYHTFQSSMANVLGMTLGAFNFHALVEAHRVLGPMFFFTFTFVVNFILINVFLAIISEALNSVTSDASNQSNDHEILDFMVHQFKSYIGFRVSPAIKPVYVEPLSGVDESFDQIEKKTEKVEMAFRNLCMEEIRHASWFDPEKCGSKKKLLLRLLLHVDSDMTETEVCDAIPLFDEVMRAYTEKDFKNWLVDYGEEFDDAMTMRSSVLFSRATLYDSDDSSLGEDSDDSLQEGRWSQLSGSTVASVDERKLLSGTSDVPDARVGTVEGYYQRYNERPPSTAERFCRTPMTESTTSLNASMSYIDRLLQQDDCQRLFIDGDDEGGMEPKESDAEDFEEVEEELMRMETPEPVSDSEERIASWMSNTKALNLSEMEQGSSTDLRKKSPRNDTPLFERSFNLGNNKNNEHNIFVDEFSD